MSSYMHTKFTFYEVADVQLKDKNVCVLWCQVTIKLSTTKAKLVTVNIQPCQAMLST